MVPHVKEKLIGAIEDLEMFLEDNQEHQDLVDSELLENARNQIQEAQGFLEGIEKEEDETEMQEDGEGKTEQGPKEGGDDDDDEEMPMGEE